MLGRQQDLEGFKRQKQHRMGLTLPQETDEVITELAEHLGVTKTQLVQNIVNDMMPTLKKTLTVARGLNSAKQKGLWGTIAAMIKGEEVQEHAKSV